jgi:hypothetical protein
MPTRADFEAAIPNVKIEVNGQFGSGKTTFALTFPRVYYIGTEPEGLEILRAPDGRHLLNNLVEYEQLYIDPDSGKDAIKEFVEERSGLLYKAVARARQMAQAGKVDTLVIDNLTYVSLLFWEYMTRYKANDYLTDKGLVNKLQMYGGLKSWLFRFIIAEVIPFKGNVVVTCHLKSESEEKMKKKKDASVDLVPNILGGFRDECEGLFAASLYLERKSATKPDAAGKPVTTTRYVCYTQQQMALGSKILAKNRYGLPPILENASYATIMAHIKSSKPAVEPVPVLTTN